MADFLPDSRLERPYGGITTPGLATRKGWGIPIFCANCGKDGGFVSEEFNTFAFYLCDDCAQYWGNGLDGYATVPDEVFWSEMRHDQLEKMKKENPELIVKGG